MAIIHNKIGFQEKDQNGKRPLIDIHGHGHPIQMH